MPALLNANGARRLSVSDGSGLKGTYAPDGSQWVTEAPGTAFVGHYAPDGSEYVTLASTGSRGAYAPDGSTYVSETKGGGGEYVEVVSVPTLNFYPGATLDMDFVNGRYRGATASQMTVSRASTGYAENSSGVWSSFADNVARITDKGLLVEEARTNSIRNNSMQGAVAGTPGTSPTNWSVGAGAGLAWSIVGTGVENGVDYIDYRLSGAASGATTPTLNFETATQIVASTGQVWTQSLFMRIAGGSTSNITNLGHNINEWTAVPAFLRNGAGVIALTPTLTRYPLSVTMGASTERVQGGLFVAVTGAGAVDITIRIGWPQLELGAFTTSPIRTTSAAVTRAADFVSLQGSNFTSWYGSPSAVTLCAEYSDLRVSSSNNTGFTSLCAGLDSGVYAGFWAWTGSPEMPTSVRTFTRADNLIDPTYGSPSPAMVTNDGSRVVQKIALTISATTERSSAQGSTLTAGTPQPTSFPIFDRLRFNGGSENLSLNAVYGTRYVRRVIVIPSLLSQTDLNTLTTASPTLDMNFTNGRYTGANVGNLTVTRASEGYAETNEGNWVNFGSGVPRITNRGLLVEESRTNLVPNSSGTGTLVGGPNFRPPGGWGNFSAAGLSHSTVDRGVENGMEYVDIRFNGTTTNSFIVEVFSNPAIAVTPGEVHTLSFFYKLQAGTLPPGSIVFRTNHRYSGGGNPTLTADNPLPSGTWRRAVGTQTAPASTTACFPGWSIEFMTVGAAVDFTLRFAWPQFELGAFATSPIRTTSSALTRAADAVSLTGANFTSWYTGTSHTLFGEAFGYTTPASSSVNISIVSIDDTTGNERIQIRRGDNFGSPFSTGIILDGGATQANISSGTGVTIQPGKIALTYAVNDANQATNGTLLTQDTSVTLPTVTQMQFGNGPGTSCWNGYIRRVQYYPARLPDAQLQRITT